MIFTNPLRYYLNYNLDKQYNQIVGTICRDIEAFQLYLIRIRLEDRLRTQLIDELDDRIHDTLMMEDPHHELQ